MSYVIEQRIMPGLPNKSLTAVKYVIAHESGNAKNNGPNALENEIAFMNRNKANAFTSHWVGGGGRIVQVAPVNKIQYGCGSKGNPYSYAQVELARTSDKNQFKKDYASYIWLLRKLAKDAGIPIVLDSNGNGIKSHRWITDNLGDTTHRDPYSYLQSMGISEEQFKKDIKNGINEEGISMTVEEKLQKQIDKLKKLVEGKADVNSSSEVATFHKDDWKWAIDNGIIKGDGKTFNPVGLLTRQQMASMLKRYHDKYVVK